MELSRCIIIIYLDLFFWEEIIMWYSNAYRRHLCDMHIEDWDNIFFSEFSAEEYFESIKKAKIQNEMIYAQSHVGYCYYPTRIGKMHSFFEKHPNEMKKLEELCHQEGIKVTGYYSLIFNNWAHDKFPEWRMVEIDGCSLRAGSSMKGEKMEFADKANNRYGMCCPNNPEYREFVFAQIDEILEFFKLDAMFFDMLFWNHFCYCEHCQKRWKREVGGSLPTEDWNNPMWYVHLRKRQEWMGEFAKSVTNKVKSSEPDMPVEHNLASAAVNSWRLCSGEAVNAASDYAGGDFGGGMLQQSYVCKFYKNITNNQPFEYMFPRCQYGLTKHTTTKSFDMMLAQILLTAAHHGATLVIDAMDPIGTIDGRVYDRLRKAFEIEEKYEPYFAGEMIEDVGIYYSLKSKFNKDGEPYNSLTGTMNAMETMINYNIPVGITGSFHGLDDYKMIIAPSLTNEDRDDNSRLIEYVKQGGILYFSTANNEELVKLLLDAEICGKTEENLIYISPIGDREGIFGDFNKDYPMPFDGRGSIIKMSNRNEYEEIATITLPYTNPSSSKFASIHSNPPGIRTKNPGVVKKKYGKGIVIWSAVPIESLTGDLYQEIFKNIVLSMIDDISVLSNAAHNVEIVSFYEKNAFTVSTIQLINRNHAERVYPFYIKLKTDKLPISVKKLPEERELSFEYKNGYVEFLIDDMRVFNMYKIYC